MGEILDISELVNSMALGPVQDLIELEWFLCRFVHGKHSVLEIGCANGAMLASMALRLEAPQRVRGISLPADTQEAVNLTNTVEILRQNCPDSYVATTDSRAPSSVAWAAQWAPYDVIFIDADHSYDGVRADWENYGGMSKIVAFHDIADRNFGTKLFWEELKEICVTEERITNPKNYKGIGVVIQES